MTTEVDNTTLIKRLKKDRAGLIKQGNELREGIVELQRRFLMVKGALQYVSQILAQEEKDVQRRTD